MDKQKDSEKFLNAFMSVWSVHKTTDPQEIVLDAYWDVLSEFDIKDVEKAFGYALTKLKFFPKPYELISFLESGPGEIEDIAIIEADKVVKAIREVGQYKSVTFDNPVTMAVVNQGWGGWIKTCNLMVDDIKWFKKDFVKIYKAYANQGIKYYGHLIGSHEDHNLQRWPDRVEPPVLIGDRDKAQKVLEYKKSKLKLIESKS